MTSFRKKLMAGLAAILVLGGGAIAAGMFPGFPIVGYPAYCISFLMNPTTGVATTTCNGPQTPAGPATITGNELIPADTQLSQGQAPQTVLITPASLGAGPYVYNAPLTGASITLTNLQRRLVLEPAGTIATLTVVFPAAATLIDGQLISLCTTQIVTALTITPGTGTTVNNTVTALLVPVATGAASCPEWVYRELTATTGTWYRTQ